MKEKHKYYVKDLFNLGIFFSVFVCFLVSAILGVNQTISGMLGPEKLIGRICLLMLCLLPFAIKKLFKVTFSRLVSCLYYIFLFLSGFLGANLEFYKNFELWDILVHFLMGVGLALLSIFVLNHTIYKHGNKHNFTFTAIFMVSFSVLCGVIWEIFEFVCDLILNSSFQRFSSYTGRLYVGKNAILDTMLDLIMDLSGAVFSVIIIAIAIKVSKNVLKTFKFRKLRDLESEVENLEE